MSLLKPRSPPGFTSQDYSNTERTKVPFMTIGMPANVKSKRPQNVKIVPEPKKEIKSHVFGKTLKGGKRKSKHLSRRKTKSHRIYR